LGTVPSGVDVGDTITPLNRNYHDGYVGLDLRLDNNGNPINDGFTNSWKYLNNTQVTSGGDIAFHAYGASSTGAGVKAKSGTAAGWELQVGRSFGRIGRKIGFSIVAGFSFSDMNVKKTGTVPAQLNILTDVYSLSGQPVPLAPYTGPSTSSSVIVYDTNGLPLLDSSGNIVTTTRDSTTLLSGVPISRSATTGTTDVKGRWQIKGAYYTFRVGPMLQFPITERLKFSLGAGVGLAYVGSDYRVDEEMTLPDTETVVQTQDDSVRSAWLPCFYVDADAEYWLTDRTGFYLGATAQRSGSYEQTVGGRTATIDLGSTYGLQSGITLRF
jgi:hypothetical protein